jgi:hypothetical protein
MPGFTESNITLNFPDANYFRLSVCPGYTALSGNFFKEMDGCWYDNATNTYWLFELKDYSLASLSTVEYVDKRVLDITKKAIDSLLMFLSNKHRYTYGLNFDTCFPFQSNDQTRFNFVTVIHCDATQKGDIQLINEKFKNRFKPYALLFDVVKYSVVEHDSATRIIPNNMVQ